VKAWLLSKERLSSKWHSIANILKCLDFGSINPGPIRDAMDSSVVLDSLYSVRKFLLIKGSRRCFYVDRFLRQRIDYIYSSKIDFVQDSFKIRYDVAITTLHLPFSPL
jgi:hypothetical protein